MASDYARLSCTTGLMNGDKMSQYECLVDVYDITEYRDNSVYRTKLRERTWIDIDERLKAPKGVIYAPISERDIISIRRRNN